MVADERERARQVRAGQAIYNKWVLAAYDLGVLRVVTPTLWHCDPRALQRNYQDNVGVEHVDIGVGTGYFLAHCRFPVRRPRLTLVDLNPTALDYTAHRLAHYRPRTVLANALEPLPLAQHSADSVGMNYLLHCLPGDLAAKGAVFAQAARVVRPGGRVFGATILAGGVPRSRPTQLYMRLLNAVGVLHNERDHLTDLREQLSHHFAEHRVTVHGCVAVFAARTAG